ncbi:MAG: ABC transporter permease [Eubacteriales bacterium]
MKKRKVQQYGFISSVCAILIGLLVGLIVLTLSNPSQAWPGFITILTGSLTRGAKGIGQVFYYATPIILTGLSVGFAFRTGLFNIGASGQFIVGGFGAIYAGLAFNGLGSFHWVVCVLFGCFFGAVWGFIPGILKAYYNVNEVIASIMLNYIGMYLVNWTVKGSALLFNRLRNESKSVPVSAQIPKMNLDVIFDGSSVHAGIFIAIITVVIIYLLLNKTKFGYELKAVGFNRNASKYAGINEKKCIMQSMTIAGAISGLAGSMVYLGGTGKHIEIVDVLASEGVTGISVALLGGCHPIGILFSGIFIAYLTAGGFYLQLFDFSTEIIDIIIAVIIYFSAFSLIVKNYMEKLSAKKSLQERGVSGVENVILEIDAKKEEEE